MPKCLCGFHRKSRYHIYLKSPDKNAGEETIIYSRMDWKEVTDKECRQFVVFDEKFL